MCKKFVAYYRVSTQKQGNSGLGLDAQKTAVLSFINGGSEIVAEFVEVESGSRKDRPELLKAFEACRLYGAKLVIAKLDRLARNAAFLLSLKDAGLDFVAADMPDANRMTIGLLAVVAEGEREMISARTKAALAAAKANGKQLGNPDNLTNHEAGNRTSATIRAARADQAAARLLPVIEAIKAAGITTLVAIAEELNRRGIEAPRAGSKWHATSVARVLARGK